MRHYPCLDPAVKARARARGIDLEKSTSDFLLSIRVMRGGRRDVWEQLNELMTGPRLSMVAAVDEWYAAKAEKFAARKAA